MTKGAPFLGTVATFKAAYPDVQSIRVHARHEGDALSDSRKTQSYSEYDLPPVLPCVNPLCQQGGYDLTATLIALTHGKQPSHHVTWHCNGHEGSPKGRRRGDSCSNYVEVDFQVTYKPRK